MIRKQLAFTLQQQCTELGIELKRSHAHELIAAYWGFASQAAMDTRGLIYSESHHLADPDEFDDDDDFVFDNTDSEDTDESSVLGCIRRAQDLGYPTPSAERVVEALERLIDSATLAFIEYDDFADTYWGLDSLDDELRATLEKRAEKKHPGALYALASLCRMEAPPSAGDGYWYRAQQAGQTLNAVQTQFAEEYAARASHYKDYRALLCQAATFGHPKAAFEWAEQDEANAEHWIRRAAEGGHVAAQAAMADITGLREWQLKAAEGGDFESLYELAQEAAEKHDEASKVAAHKWVYLAELHGHNLTQTRVDNDEDYGPVEVIFEGVWLPKLSAELKAEAERAAQGVFDARSY